MEGPAPTIAELAAWIRRGAVSHERYVNRAERIRLDERQAPPCRRV